MNSNKMRFLNMMENVKIKKEKLDEYDDEDDVVQCKLCSKGFASTMALMNHAKVEHITEYVAGEDLCVELTAPKTKPTRAQQREENKLRIKRKTEELISSMSPTDLMSFASPDVSYIIIKDGSNEEPDLKRRRDKTVRKRKIGENDEIAVNKEKEPLPISGPFECVQPSTLVAEGICHQIFFSCCEYSIHYRDEHTRRRKGIKCQVCEKVLGSTVGSAPHCCKTCGKGFETLRELTDHTSTYHVKLKPFQCSICNKRFTQQGGLQQHMRMHNGDRPFSCSICLKSFTQKSGLDQHFRIHTKVRPYRCVICSKCFCQSIHLKQHMRTHTNVSPFECAFCQKRFKQSSHLNYHLKYHNPANMSEEQRSKYDELMGMIGKTKMVQVEVEVDPINEEIYETGTSDDVVIIFPQGMEGGDSVGELVDNVQTEYILGNVVVEGQSTDVEGLVVSE